MTEVATQVLFIQKAYYAECNLECECRWSIDITLYTDGLQTPSSELLCFLVHPLDEGSCLT